MRVQTAPVLIAVGVGVIDPLREVQFLVVAGRLVRLAATAADPVVEQSADREGVVADEFGVEALGHLVAMQPVARVGGAQLRGGIAGPPVSFGKEHRAHDVLHVPAALHEFDGQPVQQLGIRRRLALRSEVVQDLGNSRPEEELPQSIHEDPRGQRVVAIHEPVR